MTKRSNQFEARRVEAEAPKARTASVVSVSESDLEALEERAVGVSDDAARLDVDALAVVLMVSAVLAALGADHTHGARDPEADDVVADTDDGRSPAVTASTSPTSAGGYRG